MKFKCMLIKFTLFDYGLTDKWYDMIVKFAPIARNTLTTSSPYQGGNSTFLGELI